MERTDHRSQIQEELLLAKQSRKEGNEGRARVCARRAAGAAVIDLNLRQGMPSTPDNAYQSLIAFQKREGLPDRIRLALTRLIRRVDENHHLPPGVDLIDEAAILINYLEGIE
jgi:hypothetical protein